MWSRLVCWLRCLPWPLCAAAVGLLVVILGYCFWPRGVRPPHPQPPDPQKPWQVEGLHLPAPQQVAAGHAASTLTRPRAAEILREIQLPRRLSDEEIEAFLTELERSPLSAGRGVFRLTERQLQDMARRMLTHRDVWEGLQRGGSQSLLARYLSGQIGLEEIQRELDPILRNMPSAEQLRLEHDLFNLQRIQGQLAGDRELQATLQLMQDSNWERHLQRLNRDMQPIIGDLMRGGYGPLLRDMADQAILEGAGLNIGHGLMGAFGNLPVVGPMLREIVHMPLGMAPFVAYAQGLADLGDIFSIDRFLNSWRTRFGVPPNVSFWDALRAHPNRLAAFPYMLLTGRLYPHAHGLEPRLLFLELTPERLLRNLGELAQRQEGGMPLLHRVLQPDYMQARVPIVLQFYRALYPDDPHLRLLSHPALQSDPGLRASFEQAVTQVIRNRLLALQQLRTQRAAGQPDAIRQMINPLNIESTAERAWQEQLTQAANELHQQLTRIFPRPDRLEDQRELEGQINAFVQAMTGVTPGMPFARQPRGAQIRRSQSNLTNFALQLLTHPYVVALSDAEIRNRAGHVLELLRMESTLPHFGAVNVRNLSATDGSRTQTTPRPLQPNSRPLQPAPSSVEFPPLPPTRLPPEFGQPQQSPTEPPSLRPSRLR